MPTVGDIAALVGGRVIGDPGRQVSGVAELTTATAAQLSFLANPKYREQFEKTAAGAVIVPESVQGPHAAVLIQCQNPYLAMARISQQLHPAPTYPAGVEPGAIVDASARCDPSATIRAGAVIDADASIGPRTVIGPGCVVGASAAVGADVLMHPGAKLLSGCRLGDRVILQAGAVIGSDGFGYAVDERGRREKIPQIGIVVVEDDVEIGANATIDRAAFGVTRIGAGTKIDNLVQIAHNVVMGRDCVIVSQTGIAGSATLGDRVVVGAQAGIVGHIKIADDVMLGARSGVPNDVSESGVYSGTPILPHRQWLKVAMAQQHVPELRRRVRQLEERLAAIERGAAPQ
ncbi:MAG: UDP-3-O-(3-hydroxymyristoyl)glucosamine N-acyltransferase [Deltaproteobacteria bacterium]|nr:UDP-3-O-(3-hydroxymyristoyl)glucosamine N-acyltransferase [Deltaproteobacteria bacterium]